MIMRGFFLHAQENEMKIAISQPIRTMFLIGVMTFLVGCNDVKKQIATFHSVSMRNSGAEIYDYQVMYGTSHLRGATGDPDPEFPEMSDVTVLGDMVIPDQAVVSWKLASGETIEHKVPLRNLIKNPNAFHGVILFYSQDADLGVFVLDKVGNPDLSAREVFSTNPSIKRF